MSNEILYQEFLVRLPRKYLKTPRTLAEAYRDSEYAYGISTFDTKFNFYVKHYAGYGLKLITLTVIFYGIYDLLTRFVFN